ncbi:MAG: LicD family protein [Chlamydiales bacterium]|nr:LicD family protein [Chlamydiia bacterium]MCP5507731.1 LicD family protein [Chlamydiales bacterium]
MSWEIIWNGFYEGVLFLGLPLVYVYHLVCGDVFLNSDPDDARGLEKVANVIMAPSQYVLVGERAIPRDDGTYRFVPRFNYREDGMMVKTAVGWALAPFVLPVGASCKAVACLTDSETRSHIGALYRSKREPYVASNSNYYRSIGLDVKPLAEREPLVVDSFHPRRPGDENHLANDKAAMREIITILEKYDIPYWVDCGTCLGAYRYGGIIPWDNDVDIGVLQPDFDNVFTALRELDSDRFVVLDWSARINPKTYMLVYVRDTGTLIDVYTYRVDPEKKQLSFIVSNIESIFLPDSWKNRESRYTVPVSFDTIFPLRQANFDGMSVSVPNKTKAYLQTRYGENIDPVRVYDETTGRYERDLSHPYWAQEGNHH